MSGQKKPNGGDEASGWNDSGETGRRLDNNMTEQRHDSNLTTQESEVDRSECISNQLLIERQAHSCDIKETIEESQRRLFKMRAELMNELIMLEQGVVQDTLEKLLNYQVKRRDMPEWEEIALEFTNSQEENNMQELKVLQLEPKDNFESDEEIEDNDMIDIMDRRERPSYQGLPDDKTTTSNSTDSRRATDTAYLKTFNRRESEIPRTDEESENSGEGGKENQFGLFGIGVHDSEDDGDILLPNQPHLASSRFSFIDANLDKFTVIQFMENQTLNISKRAGNQI